MHTMVRVRACTHWSTTIDIYNCTTAKPHRIASDGRKTRAHIGKVSVACRSQAAACAIRPGTPGSWRTVAASPVGPGRSLFLLHNPVGFGRGVVAVVHKRTPDVSKNILK